MSPKRVYWLAFAIFGFSATVGVALDPVTGAADISTAAAAAGTVTVIYGAVVALRDPDHARSPSDWGPLEHGVVAAGLYTADVAFQSYVVVT